MTTGRRKQTNTQSQSGLVWGWREWVSLPDLGIARIKAKVDTGARTSAIHATHMKLVERDGETFVRFNVTGQRGLISEAPLLDQRHIKNTSGTPEERLVISTRLMVGGKEWPIELSLADRAEMKFDLILGRTAIRRHKILVDPSRSFLTDNLKPLRKEKQE